MRKNLSSSFPLFLQQVFLVVAAVLVVGSGRPNGIYFANAYEKIGDAKRCSKAPSVTTGLSTSTISERVDECASICCGEYGYFGSPRFSTGNDCRCYTEESCEEDLGGGGGITAWRHQNLYKCIDPVPAPRTLPDVNMDSNNKEFAKALVVPPGTTSVKIKFTFNLIGSWDAVKTYTGPADEVWLLVNDISIKTDPISHTMHAGWDKFKTASGNFQGIKWAREAPGNTHQDWMTHKWTVEIPKNPILDRYNNKLNFGLRIVVNGSDERAKITDFSYETTGGAPPSTPSPTPSPTPKKTCERPRGWCGHGGSTYTVQDLRWRWHSGHSHLC